MASAVIVVGTVTTGLAVSCTLTVKDRVAVFPWASMAEQSTSVLPIENDERWLQDRRGLPDHVTA